MCFPYLRLTQSSSWRGRWTDSGLLICPSWRNAKCLIGSRIWSHSSCSSLDPQRFDWANCIHLARITVRSSSWSTRQRSCNSDFEACREEPWWKTCPLSLLETLEPWCVRCSCSRYFGSNRSLNVSSSFHFLHASVGPYKTFHRHSSALRYPHRQKVFWTVRSLRCMCAKCLRWRNFTQDILEVDSESHHWWIVAIWNFL